MIRGATFEVTMLLKYILLLTMVRMSVPFCGRHCLTCRGDCCVQCETGYETDECKCKWCGTNCYNRACLKASGSCGIMGCRSGWYGPRCEKRSYNDHCRDNCIACRYSCCVQCEEGYEGCNCKRCKNKCFIQTCLQNVGTCGVYGCKSGWYGPQCDKSCDDCPRELCDFDKDSCHERPVKTDKQGKHDDGITAFMKDKGKSISLFVGIAMLLLSMAMGVYIFIHRKQICKRERRNEDTELKPVSERLLSTQGTNVNWSIRIGRNFGAGTRNSSEAVPRGAEANICFAEASAPPAEVSASHYDIPHTTDGDEAPPPYSLHCAF